MIVINVPLKPMAKQSVKFSSKSNAFYKKKDIKSYENALYMLAVRAMRGRDVITGAVRFNARFYFNRPKNCKREYPTVKPDDDNLCKVRDAFNGVVWSDDSQVVESHLYKLYTDGSPYTIFEIEAI